MKFRKVCVIGLGYVGITLAVTLAKKGFEVFGYDLNKKLIETLEKGRSYLYEPGTAELIKEHYGKNFFASTSLKNGRYDVIIICVSTPFAFDDRKPDLSNVEKAVQSIGSIANEDALVIVRSTVPIGTTRKMVGKPLKKLKNSIHVAFCPERTIQGTALRELVELPQIVGGVDEKSTTYACEFFSQVAREIVKVSSVEIAEMVKLINNSHTDLIYSFGNEVALMAEKFNLDPCEAIAAANLNYPRPDLIKPGFVGGGCLSKDPYILIDSFAGEEYTPKLVLDARKLNEKMPAHIANNMLTNLKKINKKMEMCKVFVCGFAYKGQPATDDMRASPVTPFLEIIKDKIGKISGHDFVVKPEQINKLRVAVTDIESGFKDADAVVFLNNHKEYKKLNIDKLIDTMNKPALIYDCWRLFEKDKINSIPGAEYHSIGI